ncbi:MAG: hypothetical protein CM1200mP3_13200 [Chloroflexota bacterium]|nr:MAG: hypothetical protein CM1200mP3_13200 [Chloroflexota bacterium]
MLPQLSPAGFFFSGFGFFFEPIRTPLQLEPKTLLSGAYAVSRVESSILGPFLGYLIQKLGPRVVMFTAFLIFGLGYVIISQANSVLVFYLGFCGTCYRSRPSRKFIAVMTSINNWFLRNRAKAIGFAMLGLGVGGVAFPPLLAFGLNNFTWKSVAATTGIFVAIVGGLVSLLLRSSPEPYGYTPDGFYKNPTEENSFNAELINGKGKPAPIAKTKVILSQTPLKQNLFGLFL